MPAAEIKQGQNKVDAVVSAESKADLSKYFARCSEAITKTEYLLNRGISMDVVRKFNIGYDEKFTDQGKLKIATKAVIFPTSSSTYEARITESYGTMRYRKHGATSLFNKDVLISEKEKPIFIVEGIIDALSVITAGGQAVGLSSANNYKLLLDQLSTITPSMPLVLLLDNDDAGKKASSELAAALKERKIPFFDGSKVLDHKDKRFKDPNERLVQDKNGFCGAIEELYLEISSMPDPKEIAMREYINTSAGKSTPAFIEYVKGNASRTVLSTGFDAIDGALDGGLHTGLYFIGAVSSLGKTTLLIQIADNLAKQGQDVLFFSLEQSKYELMSKSLSRETYLYCRAHNVSANNAKSSLGIMDGRRWSQYSTEDMNVMNGAFDEYQRYADHIFIYEGIGNITVQEIRDNLKKHISVTGNQRPVVFIDYLQILKAADGDERASDKQIVDHNVTALKQLSRDFDIPVMAVSSLNRQSYAEKISMAAFKESGAIEYGSDVLIGLQLSGVGTANFNIDTAKEEIPRKVDFCILKNRSGRINTAGIKMVFHPVFNCFLLGEPLEQDGGLVTFKEIDVPDEELPF